MVLNIQPSSFHLFGLSVLAFRPCLLRVWRHLWMFHNTQWLGCVLTPLKSPTYLIFLFYRYLWRQYGGQWWLWGMQLPLRSDARWTALTLSWPPPWGTTTLSWRFPSLWKLTLSSEGESAYFFGMAAMPIPLWFGDSMEWYHCLFRQHRGSRLT